jgi:hypothetical protein
MLTGKHMLTGKEEHSMDLKEFSRRGVAARKKLPAKQRSAIARKAARARWAKKGGK